ncbi:unnamed protein product [Medioppia subpectinata]|uniref:Legumain prodomain domain-containing protein n=1 Tax=Medioppia subpectinata TaxID=1979941 RepID=A0A7R9KFV7_9ACAR|nr:unnamed protein product [Medioppia subpectinata]CAG2102804.1 unnamed protein product [Medioppia subpectinata]
MHQAKKYAKLLVNIEACNSGSMFEKALPKDINVYVTTSANSQKSSYFKNYDNLRHTYLGDYYYGAWLVVIEKQDLTKVTLEQSYKYTVSSQNKSHPQQYGTLAINKLTVFQFLGSMFEKPLPKDINVYVTTLANPQESSYAKDYDNLRHTYLDLALPMLFLCHRLNIVHKISIVIDLALHIDLSLYVAELQRLLTGRQYMDKHIAQYVQSVEHMLTVNTDAILNGKHVVNNAECYHKFVDTFDQQCFNINQNTYGFGNLQVFVNVCEQLREPSDANIVVDHLVQYCNNNVSHNNMHIE